MTNEPDQQDDGLIDPRVPGRARTIYTIVAVIVVISMIVALGGSLVWDYLF